MAAPAPVASDATVTPTWGLGDAAVGWVIAYLAAFTFSLALFPVFGYPRDQLADNDVSLVFIALGYPPLWLGFVGAPIWAAARKGNGWVKDFRVRMKPVDVPLGIAVGVATQFIVVPLVSWPVMQLTNTDAHDLAKPAHDLADKAHGFVGVALFTVIVVIGAPLAEEL